MTDTTDISALREAAAMIAHGYKQSWGCETNEDTGFVGVGTFDHDGDLCPFIEVSVSNWSDEDGDDERLAEFLTLANPVAIIVLLDQLEAERQRADELSERQSKNGVGKLQSEVIRLRIENAALKAKLANPVVLPTPFCAVTDYVYDAHDILDAINAAGFTVKGE